MIATPTTRTRRSPRRRSGPASTCFCQKPLCHDVFECRELARLAKEKNVVTQMGIQGRASPATT
jgi:hypothetical protein